MIKSGAHGTTPRPSRKAAFWQLAIRQLLIVVAEQEGVKVKGKQTQPRRRAAKAQKRNGRTKPNRNITENKTVLAALTVSPERKYRGIP